MELAYPPRPGVLHPTLSTHRHNIEFEFYHHGLVSCTIALSTRLPPLMLQKAPTGDSKIILTVDCAYIDSVIIKNLHAAQIQ